MPLSGPLPQNQCILEFTVHFCSVFQVIDYISCSCLIWVVYYFCSSLTWIIFHNSFFISIFCFWCFFNFFLSSSCPLFSALLTGRTLLLVKGWLKWGWRCWWLNPRWTRKSTHACLNKADKFSVKHFENCVWNNFSTFALRLTSLLHGHRLINRLTIGTQNIN